MSLVDDIDALLPQTQCGQCGYPGCRPYAEAIARGETTANRCPPGGQALERRLAALLEQPSLPLIAPPDSHPGMRLEAVIREDECIGCTKCIQACPVDAIVGARQFMHTVISFECSGCGLCVEPCPVDCIDMVLRPAAQQHAITDAEANHYRARFNARNQRLTQQAKDAEQASTTKRLRQLAARPLAALPESELKQLKTAWQKTRSQHQRLQEAMHYWLKRGRSLQPEQLQQLQELEAEMQRLQQAIQASAPLVPSQDEQITKLRLAVTEAELALRRAETATTDALKLAELRERLETQRTALFAVIHNDCP